jgi:hypothetical protein
MYERDPYDFAEAGPAADMSLVTQMFILERYGLRLSLDQLALAIGVKKNTLYNQVTSPEFPIKTYLDGGKRWADYRDVAAHIDRMHAKANGEDVPA